MTRRSRIVAVAMLAITIVGGHALLQRTNRLAEQGPMVFVLPIHTTGTLAGSLEYLATFHAPSEHAKPDGYLVSRTFPKAPIFSLTRTIRHSGNRAEAPGERSRDP